MTNLSGVYKSFKFARNFTELGENFRVFSKHLAKLRTTQPSA